MKKIVLFLIMCLCSPMLLMAQQKTLSGVVKDSEGDVLIGATIMEVDTSNGATSEVDGKYTIRLKTETPKITVSYLGYVSQDIYVGNKTTINVTLEPETTDLEEIVVVGYGGVKRANLAGAITTADVESIQKVATSNVMEALEGSVPGLQVLSTDGEPGSSISLRVRGGVSLSAESDPLVIIDGFQGGDLSLLDSNDIESFTVLKDAASTAIYGANGSNGVILVTTKSAKSGKPTVTFNSYLSVKDVMGSIDMLSPEEYVRLQYEIFGGATATSVGSNSAFVKYFGTWENIEANYAGRPGINWFEELYGAPAISYNINASISGGTNALKYNASYSHMGEDGVQINSGYKRDNFKIKYISEVYKWLTLSQEATYVQTEKDGSAMLYEKAMRFRPTNGVQGADSELLEMDTDPMRSDELVVSTISDYQDLNPVKLAYATDQVTKNKDFAVRSALKVKIIPSKLTYDLTYNFGVNTGRGSYLELETHPSIIAYSDGMSEGWLSSSQTIKNQVTNVLNYNTTINKHYISAMVGQEYINSDYQTFKVSVKGMTTDQLGLDNLSVATTPDVDDTSDHTESTTVSVFSRLGYTYNDRYIFTGTLRADGSSRMSTANKWGVFPAASLAWRMSKEDFMKNLKRITELKWRLSYGITGNARVPLYSSISNYTTTYVAMGNSIATGFYPETISNPDLRWENTHSVNLGVDLSLFKRRLNISFDAFTGTTNDMLYTSSIPTTSGFKTMTTNIGSINNKGLELSITSVNIRKKGFVWSTTLNVSTNKTEVLSLNGLEDEKTFGNSTYGGTHILRVGESVGMFYGYRTDGLYMPEDFEYTWNSSGSIQWNEKDGVAYSSSKMPSPGYTKLVDLTDDGTIDLYDREIIGNANPLFFGGIVNKFTYKSFDLSFACNFSYGNEILNLNLHNLSGGSMIANSAASLADRFTFIDENGYDISDDPVEITRVNADKTQPQRNADKSCITDNMIEDGSYLKLQNFTFGYTLPNRILKKIFIKSLRVYVSGTNLFTLTRYSGVDPSVNSSGVGVTAGVDSSSYPRARSYVCGANISF